MSGYWTLILPLILLLCFIQMSTSNLQLKCESHMAHQTFPSPDGNAIIFYICENDQGFVIKCPEGTGFLSTKTLHGCVSWAEWPNAPLNIIPTCDNGKHKRLYRHIDPRLYYACKAIDTPVLVKCPNDHAFAYTKDVVGCISWSKWKVAYQIY